MTNNCRCTRVNLHNYSNHNVCVRQIIPSFEWNYFRLRYSSTFCTATLIPKTLLSHDINSHPSDTDNNLTRYKKMKRKNFQLCLKIWSTLTRRIIKFYQRIPQWAFQVRKYWTKEIGYVEFEVFAILLFLIAISVNGRPSDTSLENDLSDKSGVQIVEINSLEPNTENEHKNTILRRLFYNVSHAGLHIPVQVIYDLPENLQKSNTGFDNAGATNITRSARNSRQRNLTQVERIKENIKQQYFGNDDLDITAELVPNEMNRSKSALALIVNRPHFFQRLNSTRNKVPIIFHLFSQPSATAPSIQNSEKNDSNAGQKFIIPILDKLKEMNKRPQIAQSSQYQEPQIAQTAPAPQIVLPVPQTSFSKVAPAPFFYPNIPFISTPTAQPSFLPYPTPALYYQPFDMYRRWPYALPNYPTFLPDLYSMFAAESAEHLRSGENCHSKVPFYSNYQRTRRTIDETGELIENVSNNETAQPPLNEGEFEYGQRRYDDDPLLLEYIDNVRQKRNVNRRKDRRPVGTGPIQSRQSEAELKRHEEKPVVAHGMRQGSDVGPQISKLIVRRGGVAIAGAGGIATAGSGGTAIVGPGGTAFTTPASAGGVAMVGPGGKVVKVPDLTNVLYGRTAANVAATGAGHATFTNKDGEVFTTSDNTGGVALVNPDGKLFGLSDGENMEYGEKTSQTKEVQLPAGARLLTTGPIIYYNPVYPTNHL